MKFCFFRKNCKTYGIFFIAFGTGIMIARVLPIGFLVFITGLALIVLGCTWMKR